jgi:thymidylate kinase
MSILQTVKFETAKREKCKASILIEGLSGHGKSTTALLIARALTDSWDKVAAIDTENRSLRLLADFETSNGNIGQFKVAELTKEIGYAPSNYLALRDYAVNELKADVVIEDSISHAWQYDGGVLDIVSRLKGTSERYKKDAYAVWGDPEVVAEKNKLLALIRDSRCHVISTVRVKEKMEYTTDANGKNKLESLGEQQIQQADLKYEPDLTLHALKPGSISNGKITYPVVRVEKSRYAIFELGQEYELTPTLLKQLKEYLDEGADPAELREQQRLELVEALKELLNKQPNKKAIATVMKEDAGFKESKFSELPLTAIKKIYGSLIS